ncbi:MAG: type IV toxin-antitoxin system AbiEi family antitoxin domain-containing protein [Renibacterium salmoninarum]|nr:type IV toxin-antitoxin system AbiEi family antitoxin domain-containing protein [Renibacterium salmoninarum]
MQSRVREIAQSQGGVLRRLELLRAGISLTAIQEAVDSGILLRHPRGVYALPEASDWWVEARRRGAELGCVSAADARGLWVLHRPGQVHAAVTNSRISGPFVKHRSRARCSLLEVVLQCLRCLPELEALVVAESSVALRRLSLAELRAATVGHRNARIRSIVDRINPASESILETVARYLLENAGYQVQVQKYVPGIGRLDLLVDGVLGVELDGREHHSSAHAFDEDRRRNNQCVINGIPTLRIKYSLLIFHAEEFLALVAQAMQPRNRQ